jgi:hypothetical protein
MKPVLTQNVRGASHLEQGWSLPSERARAHHTVQVDNKGFGVIVFLSLVQLLIPASAALSAEATSSPSVQDVPLSLMQGAECMAAVVQELPGVTDVRVNVAPAGSGSAYPVLEFRSVDEFGRRRFTELSLFEISGANDAYVFDRSDIENDPVANRVLPKWKRRCHAGVGVITSEPGL